MAAETAMNSPRSRRHSVRALEILSETLHAKTKDRAKITAISTGVGLVSEVYRIHLSNNTSFTSSVIAKIPNHVFMREYMEKMKAEADNCGGVEFSDKNELVCDLHNREVQFYRFATLNSDLQIRVPQFYHGEYLQEHMNGLILMEDFGGVMNNEISDRLTMSVDQVNQVLDQLVTLQTFTAKETALDQLFPLLDTQLECFSNCVFHSASVLSRRNLSWFPPAVCQSIMKFSEVKALKQLLTTEKSVLVHGNLWSKDVLWSTKDNEDNLLSIIDWTGVHAGAPTTDLATLIAVNMDADDRRRVEHPLIRDFVQKRNRTATSNMLSLVQTELAYKESLKYALMKLLVVVVTNPERDLADGAAHAADGHLTDRLKALIADVL